MSIIAFYILNLNEEMRRVSALKSLGIVVSVPTASAGVQGSYPDKSSLYFLH